MLCAFVLAIAAGSGAALAEEKQAKKDLPGYYEFFRKAGKLERLPQEVQRDQQIETGQLKPIHVGKPIEDIKLPDASGKRIGLRDYVGQKNLVVVNRAWW
jgi:hypothetical protein